MKFALKFIPCQKNILYITSKKQIKSPRKAPTTAIKSFLVESDCPPGITIRK